MDGLGAKELRFSLVRKGEQLRCFKQESDESRVLMWKGLRRLHLVILEEQDINCPELWFLKVHLFSINGFQMSSGGQSRGWGTGSVVAVLPTLRRSSACRQALRTTRSLASPAPGTWPTCSVFMP